MVRLVGEYKSFNFDSKSNIIPDLLACVFSDMLSVTAGAPNPASFSAETRNQYSHLSFKLSML